jgi:hypothetical protein
MALLFHSPIEVFPLAFYLEIGFIESPSVTGPFVFLVEGIQQMRRKMNHPALDGAVIDQSPRFATEPNSEPSSLPGRFVRTPWCRSEALRPYEPRLAASIGGSTAASGRFDRR